MTCDTCTIDERTVPLAYRLGWRVRRLAAVLLGRLAAVLLGRYAVHL
jgi:hypothetical protein